MVVTVSISQFRRNIADYLDKVKQGHVVILKDEKKDQQIVKIVGNKEFNPDTFGKALKAATGVFSMKNHPAWKTKEDVVKWVKQGRLTSDRNF